MSDKWMIYLGVGMCAIVALLLVFGEKKEGTTVESEPVVEIMAEEEKETSPEPNEPSVEQRRRQAQLQAAAEAWRQANEESAAEEARIARLAEEYKQELAAKAAAKAAKEKAEQEYWADRKEWVENFPFEPTYHPELVYVPPQGEKWNVRDKDEEKMMFAVARHGFIRRFYENPLRYTRGFEMLVKIMEEYGYGNNPERIGNVYTAIKAYYERSIKAAEDPEGRASGITFNERGYSTWQEKANRAHEAIAGNMLARKRLLPGEELMHMETAFEIRDRILAEIPEEEFMQYQGSFAYKHDYEKDLKPGDPLLMK